MAKETGLTKAMIISTLTKSVHAGGAAKRTKGSKLPKLTAEQKIDAQIARLKLYLPVGLAAVKDDEHFFTRLVAWNHQKGQVRDAQVALPVIGLHATDPELLESNLAHLADLRPRELKRALLLAKDLGIKRNVTRRLVTRWLKDFEQDPAWAFTALRHRSTLKWLYGRYHVKPSAQVNTVLMQGQHSEHVLFHTVAGLKTVPADSIALAIRTFKLPWLTVQGALAARLKEPDILAAVIGAMSSTELVTNMKTLETLGVKDHAITRAALDAALSAAGTKRGASKTTLKATRAAEAADAAGDVALAGKLKQLQERQLDIQKGIEGNWLVLGDASPSMDVAIDACKQTAAVLARLVKGTVTMTFFDNTPEQFDATGKTLEEITQMTRFVRTRGGTSIGCGLQQLVDQAKAVDGIVVISDGEENSPPAFISAYKAYVAALGNEPTVYFYWLRGTGEPFVTNCRNNGLDIQTFDLRGGLDYYSLPNLVQTMRVGRYSLTDEILATPLRTLDEVLDRTKGMPVILTPEAVSA